MKKPAIPAVIGVGDHAVASLLRPMKENLEIITGVRGGQVQTLPNDADLASVVAKINEIIGRLNAHE